MKVELILDSDIRGTRVTLFRVTYPRIVHAELLRHRSFSICSSSSRAIPLDRMIEQYTNFIPTKWRKHQPGMQPDELYEFTEKQLYQIESIYVLAREQSIQAARALHQLGVAKEQVNRLIEPYSNITHLMQGTEKTFRDFFTLRCTPEAQYEIRELAMEMQKQYNESKPYRRDLHIPFVQEFEMNRDEYDIAMRVSSARCARTSYYNHDGKTPNVIEDFKLANQLLQDKHMSPFEFVVMDWRWASENIFSTKVKRYVDLKEAEDDDIDLSGNLKDMSLVQYRKLIEFEQF